MKKNMLTFVDSRTVQVSVISNEAQSLTTGSLIIILVLHQHCALLKPLRKNVG
jgi:hypothetical protein